MRIVVIGGTGLIGTKVVSKLRERGHEAVAASPSSGVNTLTGAGLDAVLTNADKVIDVSNSPSFEDAAVLNFFETSTRNVLAAEARARVKHHIALSVVGADRVPDSGYLRAKLAQEKLIAAGRVPFTILRATQFFEFIGSIADGSTEGKTVRLSSAMLQPIAAEDVAAGVVSVALAEPVNGTVELAGPEPIRMDEAARRLLSATHDERQVTRDDGVRYYGAKLDDRSLTPGDHPRLGTIRFEEWLSSQPAHR
jgi:uncharacterized protein YbjT (DUF2867 family)